MCRAVDYGLFLLLRIAHATEKAAGLDSDEFRGKEMDDLAARFGLPPEYLSKATKK